MAKKNKVVEDLTSDDDDPTAELEALTTFQMPEDAEVEREADATTFGFSKGDSAPTSDTTPAPDLHSDLNARGETIGRLQHDVEQLRSKWLGLEAEISARKEMVESLTGDVDALTAQLARKERLLNKREDKINSLTANLRARQDESQLLAQRIAELEQRLAEQRTADTEKSADVDDARREADQLRSDLAAANNEIAVLKAEIEQRTEAHRSLDEYRAEIEKRLADNAATLENVEFDLAGTSNNLDNARQAIASLDAQLSQRGEAYAALQKQLGELQLETARKTEALQSTEHELSETRSSLDIAKDEIARLGADVKNSRESHGLLQQNQVQLEQQISDYTSALQESEGELQNTRQSLANAQEEIASLDAAIAQRDEAYRSFEERHGELDRQLAETAIALSATENELERMIAELEKAQKDSARELELTKKTNDALIRETKSRLVGAEKYADTLRYKLQAFSDSESQWSKERVRLEALIEQEGEKNRTLSQELEAASESMARMQTNITQQQSENEQEIGRLRLELAEVQQAAAKIDDLNKQMSTDLDETHRSREELEQLLSQQEVEAQKRIDELEKQIRTLAHTADDLDEKLETKNAAFNALLAELAKKSEQLESIGAMEEVIQEIDNRMSGRIDEPAKEQAPKFEVADAPADRDRTTRVLIGKFGDKELRFPLFKKRLTIGRVAENDIQLKTSYISRRHALVLIEDDVTRIIDTNSRNGVFVNTKRVRERSLSNGDTISIGNVKFRYEERPKRDP